EREHVRAKLRHPPRELTIPASDIEHVLFGPQIQQPLLCGANEGTMELVALTHALVPEVGVAVPDLADGVVQPRKFSSHRDPPVNSRASQARASFQSRMPL